MGFDVDRAGICGSREISEVACEVADKLGRRGSDAQANAVKVELSEALRARACGIDCFHTPALSRAGRIMPRFRIKLEIQSNSSRRWLNGAASPIGQRQRYVELTAAGDLLLRAPASHRTRPQIAPASGRRSTRAVRSGLQKAWSAPPDREISKVSKAVPAANPSRRPARRWAAAVRRDGIVPDDGRMRGLCQPARIR